MYFSNVFFWSSLTAEINRFSFNHLVVFIFRRATSQLPLPPTPSPLLSDRRQRQPRHLRTLSECQHLSRRRHLSLKYDHNVNTFSVHFLICTSSSPFCLPLFTRPWWNKAKRFAKPRTVLLLKQSCVWQNILRSDVYFVLSFSYSVYCYCLRAEVNSSKKNKPVFSW